MFDPALRYLETLTCGSKNQSIISYSEKPTWVPINEFVSFQVSCWWAATRAEENLLADDPALPAARLCGCFALCATDGVLAAVERLGLPDLALGMVQGSQKRPPQTVRITRKNKNPQFREGKGQAL